MCGDRVWDTSAAVETQDRAWDEERTQHGLAMWVRRGAQRTIILVLAALASAGPAVAQAGGTGSGTVVNFTPAVINGVEFYVLTLSSMSTASCATSGRFALSASDPKYKTTVAILLGAFFSGAAVFARGLGTCNLYGGSEDLAYVCADNGVPC